MRCYLYYAGSAFEKPEPYRSLGEAKDAIQVAKRANAAYRHVSGT